MHKWPSDIHLGSLWSHRSLIHTHVSIAWSHPPAEFSLNLFDVICLLPRPNLQFRVNNMTVILLVSLHRWIFMNSAGASCIRTSVQQIRTPPASKRFVLHRLFSNQLLMQQRRCRHVTFMTGHERVIFNYILRDSGCAHANAKQNFMC